MYESKRTIHNYRCFHEALFGTQQAGAAALSGAQEHYGRNDTAAETCQVSSSLASVWGGRGILGRSRGRAQQHGAEEQSNQRAVLGVVWLQ